MTAAKRYRVIYRLELPGRFTDVELIVDHLPDLGAVVRVPDGSDRYGRVISIERVRD